ncbi:GtrA family protein [Kribbella antibiotica]|uniref:GtrA family protein n=1 Tax=Kribbella antibiotica TaxID=190195 RepID=UPI001404FCF1|nr:GtrA family protein [Kribbella antibiotica]
MRILYRLAARFGLRRSRMVLWAKYSASQAISTAVSQVAFALCYFFGAAALWATVIAWMAGGIPNYALSRRWAWNRRGQMLPYAIIVVGSAAVAALTTTLADQAAQAWVDSRFWQTMAVSGSYFATFAALFVVKFWLFDSWVFAAPVQPLKYSQVSASPSSSDTVGA